MSVDETLQWGIVEGLLALAFVLVCAIAHFIQRRIAEREADRTLEQHFLPDRPLQLTYRGARYVLPNKDTEAIAQIPVQYRGTATVVTVSSSNQLPEGVTPLKFRGIPYLRIH
ncbi:MAG TPA: DUF4278 domain-containing protein [Synechococcales cyanobacterium M55_K2018_004]|nr:DUF4278 domain-containing protein [Synechococcales cyanobacterium M55_K2018_004]